MKATNKEGNHSCNVFNGSLGVFHSDCRRDVVCQEWTFDESVTPWPVLRKWIAGGEETIILKRFHYFFLYFRRQE